MVKFQPDLKQPLSFIMPVPFKTSIGGIIKDYVISSYSHSHRRHSHIDFIYMERRELHVCHADLRGVLYIS